MRVRSSAIAIALTAFFLGAGPCTAAQAPSAFHLLEATIADVRAAIASEQTTCRGLVDLYVKRMKAYDNSGPALNAVQTINPSALAEADRLDAAFRTAGPVGPLHCIPVLLKDEVETADMPTTFGSVLFKDFVTHRDATIVKKLKQAGAIIIAKTNMGEFAANFAGSAFGVIRNPYDPRRHASGSSGGTGAGIAANYATVGIGEDTGGSIRGPASVANLVGLRPSVPLVSRFGMMLSRPTTDTLGPIARSVTDAAIMLDAIAGYDPNDAMTAYSYGQVPATYTAYLDANGLKGARLGIIREAMSPLTDTSSEDYKKVRVVIDKAILDLKRLGAIIVDPVSILDLQARVKATYDDNVFETEEATNAYLASHPNAPVKTLRDILLSGKVVPWRASQLFDNLGRTSKDAGYLRVLAAQEETRQIVLKVMADNRLDALIYATFDHPPSVISPDVLTNPDPKDKTEYRRGNNRSLAPALAFPALTVPAGFTSDGLPVGIEFMGRSFSEGTLLRLGYAYEQGTRHRRPPPTTPALAGEP